MEKLVFLRHEVAEEIFGVKESSFSRKEKYYLDKLPPCTKQGRGGKTTYTFETPPMVVTKLKFEKVFGFKSKRATTMDAYLKFLSRNAYGFCMTDAEVAKELGEHRQLITEVRFELEQHGFLKPIKEENKQPFKTDMRTLITTKATKQEWNLYWKTYCYNEYMYRENSTMPNVNGEEVEVNRGMLHIQTVAELGYKVSFKYTRDTFSFELLAAIESYFNYTLFQ